MFFLIAVFGLFLNMSVSSPLDSSVASNGFLFATEFFSGSCKEKPQDNLIISPFSVNTALGLVYFASANKTEEELRKGLRLGTSLNKQEIAENFSKLLKAASKSNAQVQIANKIYLKEGNKINSSFNYVATKYFNSEAEQMKFTDSSKAAEIINKWVEFKTNNKIKNMLGSVDEDTEVLVINAIYFKGLWNNQFDLQSTQKLPFYCGPTKTIEVDTMYGDDNYKYGKLSELNAACLELPYKDSEMSMIFILPNDKNGLSDLQEKLTTIDIREISNKLTETSVEVFLPRFRIESDLSLKNVLITMGMKTMFSNGADLSGLFESVVPIKVTDIQQKAFIDVNEAGSEAAAATIIKISLMSYNPDKPVFRADHPFIFFLKDKNSIYFAGRVITF